MPRHGNFEAYVECEGTCAEEYGMVVKGNMVSCWIESEIGKVSVLFYLSETSLTKSRGNRRSRLSIRRQIGVALTLAVEQYTMLSTDYSQTVL